MNSCVMHNVKYINVCINDVFEFIRYRYIHLLSYVEVFIQAHYSSLRAYTFIYLHTQEPGVYAHVCMINEDSRV